MKKAVITGDIIHSTKMANEIKTGLFELVKDALKTWSSDFNMKTEMYRGDSFQCLVNNPKDSLRVALLIKTYIRNLLPDSISKKSFSSKKNIGFIPNWAWIFDARIGIGIGEVDLKAKTLANSNGEAFILSGRLLDEIKDSKQHLAIRSADKYSPEWETESILLDTIIKRTSALQCEVLNLKLLNYTETQIANRLNIGQSAVNQRSNAGGWIAIDAVLKRFENIYEHE